MSTKIATSSALLCCALALALPGTAAPSDDGGAEAGQGPPVELVARSHVMLNGLVRLRGSADRGLEGRILSIESLHPRQGWLEIGRARIRPDGSFSRRWRPGHIGRLALRAVLVGTAGDASASAASATTRLTVYLPARATWYGPGFWGRRTACGRRLTRRTLGVAHRRLPCGTRVSFYRAGRALTLRVIDRGPYAHRAAWDLTRAAAERLGMRRSGRLGAVSLAR